jgi:hypothetical protein
MSVRDIILFNDNKMKINNYRSCWSTDGKDTYEDYFFNVIFIFIIMFIYIPFWLLLIYPAEQLIKRVTDK